MKILIVDRDEVASRFIASKLEPIGHEIFEEPVKDNIVTRARETVFDIIFIDPSPLNSAHQNVLNIRRGLRYYPYIILVGENATKQEAIDSGVNDFLPKPVDPVLLDEKLFFAQDLMKLVKRLGDESEDSKSAGGIIAKSAFNQLFLSALDRSSRYGEKSFLLFISLSNYNDINHNEGVSAADFAVASMCQNLMTLRRQSDIVGQTGKNEYCLLIQRPNNDSEPVQAADRFADMILNFDNVHTATGVPFQVNVMLMEVPSGKIVVNHNVSPSATAAQGAGAPA